MAQVPYQPAPTVTPERQRPLSIGVQTPVAAFGGAVAGALEGLGKGLEGAGNELFARAHAMKELQNESAARRADADASDEMGDIHAKYQASEGWNTVNGADQYRKDLRAVYEKHRAGLDNDSARRMYDSSALGVLNRSIFAGAGYAATQQKEAAVKDAEATIRSTNNHIHDHPDDEVAYQEGRAKIRDTIRNPKTGIAAIKGWNENQTNDALEEEDRKTAFSRIVGRARDDPWGAEKELQVNKAKLGQYYEQAEEKVHTQTRQAGSRIIADDMIGQITKAEAEGRPIPTEKEMIAAIDKTAKKLAPSDSLAGDYAKSVFGTKYNAYQQQKAHDAASLEDNTKGIINQYDVKSVDAFLATPNGRAIYDRMSDTQQFNLPKLILGHMMQTQQRSQEGLYNKLAGMADEEPLRFLGIKLEEQQLSRADATKLEKLQREKRKDQDSDPHVAVAYRLLRPSLPVGFDTTANEEARLQLKGALQEAIIGETATTGKPPGRDKLIEIGRNVVREFVTGHGWFGLTDIKTPLYALPVPKEAADAIKLDWAERGRGEPNDQEMHNEYIRQRYQELFGKKSTKDQSMMPSSSPPAQPSSKSTAPNRNFLSPRSTSSQ
jgi:hypothetical protein